MTLVSVCQSGRCLLWTLQGGQTFADIIILFSVILKVQMIEWKSIFWHIMRMSHLYFVFDAFWRFFSSFLGVFMHININLYLGCPNVPWLLYAWTHKYNSDPDISAFCPLKVCLCVSPASADRCARPWLGGEGAGEGEPKSVHHSPAREVEVAVEQAGENEEEPVRTRTDIGKITFNLSLYFHVFFYLTVKWPGFVVVVSIWLHFSNPY